MRLGALREGRGYRPTSTVALPVLLLLRPDRLRPGGWRGFPKGGRSEGERSKRTVDYSRGCIALVADDDYAQKREAGRRRRRRTEEGKGGGASFAAFLPLSTHTLREAAVEEEEEGKTSGRAGEGEG